LDRKLTTLASVKNAGAARGFLYPCFVLNFPLLNFIWMILAETVVKLVKCTPVAYDFWHGFDHLLQQRVTL
jgi:hypothetical protein